MSWETLLVLKLLSDKKNISKLDLDTLLFINSLEFHVSELIKHGHPITMTRKNNESYYELEETWNR